MKLAIVSIVLDGMPFLPMQLATFNRIDTKMVDWHWHIIEGPAANVGSTSWCQPQQPRFSRDGSNEMIRTWFDHPRISIKSKMLWEGGKDQMFNTALQRITEPCVLLEADIDELWTARQIETLVVFFAANPLINCARFFCRYFVGPNIVITSTHSYGNRPGEWLRAWRFKPGMTFASHEPPVLTGAMSPCATREQTRDIGLVWDHWAYALEKQVAFKEQFYNYKNAVAHWRRLQANKVWPVTDLRQFLPWVDSGVNADLLFK